MSTDQNNDQASQESINRYSQILLDLVHLRSTDYDAFMDKLYEALTGEFRTAIYDGSPVTEKTKAIWTMIDHFKATEQYEKCASLKRLADELKIPRPEVVEAKR